MIANFNEHISNEIQKELLLCNSELFSSDYYFKFDLLF